MNVVFKKMSRIMRVFVGYLQSLLLNLGGEMKNGLLRVLRGTNEWLLKMIFNCVNIFSAVFKRFGRNDFQRENLNRSFLIFRKFQYPDYSSLKTVPQNDDSLYGFFIRNSNLLVNINK